MIDFSRHTVKVGRTERQMNTLTLDECYKILNITPDKSDDEIARAYKMLAMRYHPDKNRDKVDWATGVMSKINSAYSLIMSSRFQSETPAEGPKEEERRSDEERSYSEAVRRQKEFERQRVDDVLREASINHFVRIRENAKESLYRFFQYSLFNISRREMPQNRSIYNEVVLSLRKTYHSVLELRKSAKDPEVIEHLTVFSEMILNFYRAAECLNIPDSYNSDIEIDAFRLYQSGEELLHQAHKEIFYERHNKGSFNLALSFQQATEAKRRFAGTMEKYPHSSWTVESGIKLEYTVSLLRYLELFFSEE